MYQELIEIYKNAFPDDNGQDAGYIFRDGTVIDISKPFTPYCHGREFLTVPALVEWRDAHMDGLPGFPRPAVDIIMDELGAIEFTIDNMRMRCVRLPNKPLTAEQRQPLSEIIGRILERGSVKVEVLKTREYAEYEANVNTTEQVMSKIEAYYSIGHL